MKPEVVSKLKNLLARLHEAQRHCGDAQHKIAAIAAELDAVVRDL
jgi:hypothetical protein